VVEVRGSGLMLGIELDRPCNELVREALEAGLLINVTYDTIIRMLPPLVIDEAQADQIVALLSPLVRGFLSR
jgi:acetylornithine aminotransferase